MAQVSSLPPPVRWYQRESYLVLTIEVLECKNPLINLCAQEFSFSGSSGGPDGQPYLLSVPLLHPIDVESSKYGVRERVVEVRLEKVESIWWERLVKEKAKQHWLRVDFQNWIDEEEQEEDKKNLEDEEYHQPMNKDWSKHIAANIAKGSALCPIGQTFMGGALSSNDSSKASRSPAQQAAAMTDIDIYAFEKSIQDSDDEPISDME